MKKVDRRGRKIGSTRIAIADLLKGFGYLVEPQVMCWDTMIRVLANRDRVKITGSSSSSIDFELSIGS